LPNFLPFAVWKFPLYHEPREGHEVSPPYFYCCFVSPPASRTDEGMMPEPVPKHPIRLVCLKN
jgi:hypothetical protein